MIVVDSSVWIDFLNGRNAPHVKRLRAIIVLKRSSSAIWITSPIVGAGKLPHLEDAVASLTVSLTNEEHALLEAPYVPHASSFYREVPGKDQDR